jgi:two-component sensor histidine kinase
MNGMVTPVAGGLEYGSCAARGAGAKLAGPTWAGAGPGELDRLRILNAELQHRLLNMYTIVNSVAERSARHCGTLEDFLPAFQNRLTALARMQAGMIRSPADPDVLLYEMAVGELFSSTGGDEKVTLEGSRTLALVPRAGEIVALGIHELATNSRKYGVLLREAGQIHVSWRRFLVKGVRHLRLEWRETGIASDAPFQGRRGFGSELIGRALPRQLGAETTYLIDRRGVHCTIDIPGYLIRDVGQTG